MMSKSSAARLSEPTLTPSASACGAADALLRASAECVHQHERLGRALELACSDGELQHIAKCTELAHTQLQVTTAAYDKTATAAPEAKDQAWWHAANGLWNASNRFLQRTAGTDNVSRLAGKHSKEKLAELAMEYELERSALLALKHAVEEFGDVRAAK